LRTFEELFGLAKQLEVAAATADTEDIEQPLKVLQDAAKWVEPFPDRGSVIIRVSTTKGLGRRPLA
jgi:hypothetical protein